ncbi:molybdenum cofactor cytidylyltransferase [Neobacillus niacini]|uniref:nucleotidyltransferase family protein n=1 Tax=Neobacillus niacini TaxID=86668 RepID=UPI00277D5402|nr:nucleotidyltransferase family protein [Neobacillus niacini]MDQ1005165.1 molybdenum cofactor cytidylyltransferase [Neobacillus niacini]
MKNEVWGIVLASGLSSRMGTPKMLLPYQQKSLVRHVIEKSLNSVLDGLVVVINPKVMGLCKEVSIPGVKEVIKNNDSHLGMSTSIKAGLHSLPQQVEAAVILLGDQPEIYEHSINKVVETYLLNHKPSIVQSVFLNNEKGHPVLFNRKLFPHLLKIDGDSGGKSVVQKFTREVVYAEMNEMNIPDVDTLEDYQRLIKEEEV